MTALSPTLVVLAAGLGSRYGGLKQLDPMGPNGEPLLDYAVFDALRAGFTRVVFVIREELEASFKRNVAARYSKKIDVDYAFQALTDIPPRFSVPAGRVRPWGTLHAILAARKMIDTPFAVINADDTMVRMPTGLWHIFSAARRTATANQCVLSAIRCAPHCRTAVALIGVSVAKVMVFSRASPNTGPSGSRTTETVMG